MTEYNRTDVVRQMFADCAAGVSLRRIERGLNDGGIPSANGKLWAAKAINELVQRDTYVRKRIYQGKVVGDGQWPALVTEELLYACKNRFQNPDVKRTRPGRARWLLSYIATCDTCGSHMVIHSGTTARPLAAPTYKCWKRNCTLIEQEQLDLWVSAVVIAYLSRPDVTETLAASMGADKRAVAARNEIARMTAQLETFRKLLDTGEVDRCSRPTGLLQTTHGMQRRVRERDGRGHCTGCSSRSPSPMGPRWNRTRSARQARCTATSKRPDMGHCRGPKPSPHVCRSPTNHPHSTYPTRHRCCTCGAPPTQQTAHPWRWKTFGPGATGNDSSTASLRDINDACSDFSRSSATVDCEALPPPRATPRHGASGRRSGILAAMTEQDHGADASIGTQGSGEGFGWNLLDIVPGVCGLAYWGWTANRGYAPWPKFLTIVAIVLGLALVVAVIRKIRGVPQRVPWPFD